MYTLYKKAKKTYTKYEREFSALALLLGFVVDNLTLQRIDLAFENIVLIFYMVLIVVAIVLLQRHEPLKVSDSAGTKAVAWLQLISPFLLQYALGGLFSGLSIFYFRSATLAASWPFLFILVVVLIGNEVYAKRLHRSIVLQLAVFYFALFSFSIFFVPIIVKDISVWVFLLSGVCSIAVVSGFVALLKKFVSKKLIEKNFKAISCTVLGIYAGIHLLYFLNVIPPIPLSMKERQLGYLVERVSGDYEVTIRQFSWWKNIGITETFKKQSSQEPVYFFTSVFAPTKFEKTITHQWQKKVDGTWITRSTIPFTIVGGRDGGYRGYSYSSIVDEGAWRVQTILKNGQIVGRKTFNVEITDKKITKKKVTF